MRVAQTQRTLSSLKQAYGERCIFTSMAHQSAAKFVSPVWAATRSQTRRSQAWWWAFKEGRKWIHKSWSELKKVCFVDLNFDVGRGGEEAVQQYNHLQAAWAVWGRLPRPGLWGCERWKVYFFSLTTVLCMETKPFVPQNKTNSSRKPGRVFLKLIMTQCCSEGEGGCLFVR